MKWPMCSGKGMVDYPMYADDEHKWQYCVARMKKCDMCNGTCEVQMTNEEWLRTLPTEERVKEVLSRGFMTEKRTAEEFVEWLKQPHKDTK